MSASPSTVRAARPRLGAARARALAAGWAARGWPVAVAIAALAAGIGVAYVLRLASFFVMNDEMTYFKASQAIAELHRPLLPGDPYYHSLSELTSLLRAPAYWLGDTSTIFDASHIINVLAFASAAIPVYLLARRVLEWKPLAVLAAATSVAIPWLAMTGTMLTEPVAYPAFCWAMLGMQRSLTMPSVRSDLLAVAGIGLAFAARTQFAVLALAYVVALLVHTLARRERPAIALRKHALLVGIAVAALLVVLVGGIGTFSDKLLGAYGQTAHGSILPKGTWVVAEELLALVGIAVGLVPLGLAIGWAAWTLVRRPADREGHAFAALSVATTLAIMLAAGSFVQRFTPGPSLSDRYLFYAAPLIVIGALACLLRIPRNPIPYLLGGAAAWWVIQVPSRLYETDSPMAAAGLSHRVFNGHATAWAAHLGSHVTVPDVLGLIALAGCLILAIPRAVSPPRWTALAVGALFLAFCAAETGYSLHRASDPQKSARSFLYNADWVDRAVPDGTKVKAMVGFVYDADTTSRAWWDLLFFNKATFRPYQEEVAGNNWGQIEQSYYRLDPRDGHFTKLGKTTYVVRSLDDRRFVISGAKEIARSGNLSLQRIPARPAAPYLLTANQEDGTVDAGATAKLQVFRAPHVEISLTTAPGAARPALARVGGRLVRVRPGKTARIRASGRRVHIHAGRGAPVVVTQIRA